MSAFAEAFYILKNEHMFDMTYDALLRKGKAEEMIQLQQMRQFVLDNENSPDPAKRQAAEDMYEHITRIMSAQSRTSPMLAHGGPIGEGGSLGAMAGGRAPPEHPMMKAWNTLKKNVIGMQDGTEYNMPPSVASMAQRPQVPEMQPTGFFGRMKPTGDTTTGGPQTMDVQENTRRPHEGILGVEAAPGAEVTRIPRPGPYPGNTQIQTHTPPDRNPSLSNIKGQTPYNKTAYLHQGQPAVGEPKLQADRRFASRGYEFYGAPSAPQGAYGDQFAPRIDYENLQ